MNEIGIIEIDENFQDFDEFYKIYRSLFPKSEESETSENLKKYLALKKTDYYEGNKYHVLILKVNDKIAGFLIGDFYHRSGIAFIEFIGVADEYRGKGYSRAILEEFLNIIKKDASEGGSKPNGILIEVERPEATDNPGSFTFWDHMDFKKVECNYVQPKLSGDKERALDLMLMYSGIAEKNLKKSTLIDAVKDYFRFAISIDDPEKTEEFRILDESINSEYVILTKLGSSWFVHPSLHYFYSIDLGNPFSGKSNFSSTLQRELMKNAIAIGTLKFSYTNDDDVKFRIQRDETDYSESYLKKRYIIRGKIENSYPDFILFVPYPEMKNFERINAKINVLYSFNSIGILTLEFIINVKTTVSTGTLIYLENSENVHISGKRLKDFIEQLLNDIFHINNSQLLDSDPYPFVFVPQYGGKLPPHEIYGITEMDPSYWQISATELGKHRKKNISIVKDIEVYYEFLASMVSSRKEDNFIYNLEEIAGLQAGQLPGNCLEKSALKIVEAEYSIEIERLRVQYTMLYTLFVMLEKKEITRRYSLEYNQILDLQKKLMRKMDEIMLVDTERFPSLKRIFREAQENLGISELKSKILDIQNSLKEEIRTRSEIVQTQRTNVLNILIFALILMQLFQPYISRTYDDIIYAIVIILSSILVYSFIGKK